MDNFSSLPQLLERYFRNKNVRTAEHVIFVGFGLIALNTLLSEGFTGVSEPILNGFNFFKSYARIGHT